MANVMRHRRGDPNPVYVPVASATVVEIGDMVGLSSNLLVTASQTAFNTNEALTQDDFHALFLGVAMSQSRVGDTDAVWVATAGDFEFVADSGTYRFGEFVGPELTAMALEDQEIDGAADVGDSIGQVVDDSTAVRTFCMVRIFSTIMGGGGQTPI